MAQPQLLSICVEHKQTLTRLYAEDCVALTTVSLASNRISDISGLKDRAAVR